MSSDALRGHFERLNVLSTFAGIGGLELGLERAGMTTVGQVEIDPFCRRVLAKHWPEVPRHDDVRTAVDWWFGGPRPAVDVVCGGFPCQDISNAGRGEGITGARSGLWSYMRDVVRGVRPRYVVMENVSALLGRGLDVVAADLAESGYDLEWDCVPASALGANHQRDRWWGVAYPQRQQLRLEPVTQSRSSGAPVVGVDGSSRPLADAAGWRGSLIPEGAGTVSVSTFARPGRGASGRHPAARGRVPGRGASVLAADVGDAVGPRCANLQGGGPLTERSGWRAPDRSGWWDVEPDVARVVDGLPGRMDRRRRHALGNAVVPQVAEHIGRLILDAEARAAA